MQTGATQARPRLLYLGVAVRGAESTVLALESRVVIGVLSRDFDVSVGVVGATTSRALEKLRTDLGVSRIAGGFPSSSADRRAEPALRHLMKDILGSDIVNARLQAILQRRAGDFDAVVVDSLVAWPYRPVGQAPVVYLAHRLVGEDDARSWSMAALRSRPAKAYERKVLASADLVVVDPERARQLAALDLPLQALQHSLAEPERARPTVAESDFNRSKCRIGYTGYLSDPANLASLNWFLEAVWPVLSTAVEGIEFHVVGRAPSSALRERLAGMDGVTLQWRADDRALIDLRCRVLIEPLLHENHVDAKLVNAMARGLPTVTTRRALSRAHTRLQPGVVAVDSREGMVLSIRKLMTDPRYWKTMAGEAALTGREYLPAFELAHTLRRGLQRRFLNGARR